MLQASQVLIKQQNIPCFHILTMHPFEQAQKSLFKTSLLQVQLIRKGKLRDCFHWAHTTILQLFYTFLNSISPYRLMSHGFNYRHLKQMRMLYCGHAYMKRGGICFKSQVKYLTSKVNSPSHWWKGSPWIANGKEIVKCQYAKPQEMKRYHKWGTYGSLSTSQSKGIGWSVFPDRKK